MTRVVHESVAVTRAEVEDLARRLLMLRSEIDRILAALARSPAIQPRASDVGAPCEPAGFAAAPDADDLTLIRGIDAALRDQISSLGFDTFAQIARWSKRDVIYVSAALGLDRRISRENWIEQAAILASGGMTAFAGGRAKCQRRADWGAAIVAPRSNKAETDTQVVAGKRPSVWALQSVRARDTSPVVVPSLHPFRGTPCVVRATHEVFPPAPRGRLALAAKLAACLIGLLVAVVLTVDRNAWGSTQLAVHQPSAMPLQIGPVTGRRTREKNEFTNPLPGDEGLHPLSWQPAGSRSMMRKAWVVEGPFGTDSSWCTRFSNLYE